MESPESEGEAGAASPGAGLLQQPVQATKAQISQRSMGTMAEKQRTATIRTTDPRQHADSEELTQPADGRRRSSLPAQGEELLWEQRVPAEGGAAGPEPGAGQAHRGAALRQLLEPLDGLQGEGQSIFLEGRKDEGKQGSTALEGQYLLLGAGPSIHAAMLAHTSVSGDLLTHLDLHSSRSSPAERQDQQGDGGKGGLHVNASADGEPLSLSLSL